MHQTLAAVIEQYKFNTGVFETVLEGFDNARQFERPADKGNSVNWLAGHIARYRFSIAAMAGLDSESPWGDLYRKGEKAEGSDGYPSLDEIKSAWIDISPRMIKGLEDASEEQLTQEPRWTKPGLENTIRGTINFLAFHESYHLGQLGYIRKLLDLKGAIG